MKIVSKDTFYATIADWESVPFCQNESWVSAQASDSRKVIWFLDSDIASAGFLKCSCGVQWLQLDSPALKTNTISMAQRKQFYEDIREQGYSIVELNDRQPYEAETEIALRQAGYLRPVGSFSFQLSNYINLLQPIVFNENWKRNLKKADLSELSLDYVVSPAQADIDDLWALYEQMSGFKHLALPFQKSYLSTLLHDRRFRLYFVTYQDARISVMIVHTAGTHSGLLYAANNEQANELHAGQWMYREVLRDLAQNGYKSFDMEKLAASTHSTNAVFQFKQGIKGQLTPLNGEWQWCKRAWMAAVVYILKKRVWKRVQA